MVYCVFLGHNKTSSKQNLKLKFNTCYLFILQPLLVGSEINMTFKETLINITELSKTDPANYKIRAICYTLQMRIYCTKKIDQTPNIQFPHVMFLKITKSR